MEQSIVRRRNGSPQVGLVWNRTLVDQVERLLQQIVMIGHVYYDQAKSLRIACSDWLRKLKYGVKPQFS